MIQIARHLMPFLQDGEGLLDTLTALHLSCITEPGRATSSPLQRGPSHVALRESLIILVLPRRNRDREQRARVRMQGPIAAPVTVSLGAAGLRCVLCSTATSGPGSGSQTRSGRGPG